jgi:hypothetical protein
MTRMNRGHQRRAELLEVAEENVKARAKRTPQQQLDLLDKRLGEGLGAGRERKHLQELLTNSKKDKNDKNDKKGNRKKR